MHGIEEKYVPRTSGQAVTLLTSIPEMPKVTESQPGHNYSDKEFVDFLTSSKKMTK